MTRFSATDDAFGCTKLTLSFAPIEKLCQLMIAFCVACVTCVLVAEGRVTLALPAITCAPLGAAKAKPGTHWTSSSASMVLIVRRRAGQ